MKQLKLTLATLAAAAMTQFGAQGSLSYLNIGYYGTYGVTVYAQGYAHGTYATAFSADWQNVSGSQPLPIGHNDPFVTFCLDINTILGNGWWDSGSFSAVTALGTAVDTVPPIDPNNPTTPAIRNIATGLNSAANLYAHYAGGILNANGTWADQAKGAALQLAIWEVLYENPVNGYNVDSGSGFYVSSGDAGIRSTANTMLTTWGAADMNIDTTFWNAVNADGSFRSSQDLIGPMTPVPEPTTFIAGGLLLLPFLASTLRRRVRS
jgi:hypothetical protein